MTQRAQRRSGVIALTGAVMVLLGACGDGGDVSLPTDRPSIEISVERTTRSTPEETRTERTSEPEPTRTQDEDPEPTRTQEPEPTRTQDEEPEPTRTQQPEPTRTQEQEPEPTPTREAAESAAAVPVSDEADPGGFLGWLLLFVLLGATIAIVLISRFRRAAVWEAEASALSAETRSVTEVRLPPVLTARTAAERSLSWPAVRDDLIGLSARWAGLAGRATDDAQQTAAGTAAALLRDLVPAIDAENEALAAERDWQRLRPQVDGLLDTLAAILTPRPAPGTPPGGPAPYPA